MLYNLELIRAFKVRFFMARRSAPGTQAKAESITVRLDPKIRYGLELLARKQRRNLSSVVEWALHKAIHDQDNGLAEKDENGIDENLLYQLWDVEESDRFYLMALTRPDLLTFEEEHLIKLIRESAWYEQLREHFPTFKKISINELSRDNLPKPPKSWQSKHNNK